MEWTPLLAFAVIAVIFGVGDIVSTKTKGIVSSILVAAIALLVLGGTLRFLPEDLFAKSGIMSLIPTFGMALILVNVGSMIDLNDLKREWKTVIVALAGIAGLVIVGFTAGQLLFGREYALAAMGPASGGMVATMIMSQAANEAGRPDLAAFVAAVVGLQILVGLPIASACLHKEALRFLDAGGHKSDAVGKGKQINIRILPPTPPELNTSSLHFARLAAVGILATLVTKATGLSTGVTFLVGGILFGAIGFVEKGSLRTAGGEGILMFATFASVSASFVTMNLAQFGKMLIPAVGMLLLSAVGIVIVCSIVGKLLKWSPWLAIAVGVSCLFGYPVTQAVALEVSAGVVKGKGFSPEEEQRVVNHLLPKMIIAGTISVSIASVLLASILAPMLFG